MSDQEIFLTELEQTIQQVASDAKLCADLARMYIILKFNLAYPDYFVGAVAFTAAQNYIPVSLGDTYYSMN